jgi:hypothetical protein
VLTHTRVVIQLNNKIKLMDMLFWSIYNCTKRRCYLHKNYFICTYYTDGKQSHDSSVGIALDYGLDDRGSGVRFPAGAGNFSLHHHVQNFSGAHPASYSMGTRGSFPRGKESGA